MTNKILLFKLCMKYLKLNQTHTYYTTDSPHSILIHTQILISNEKFGFETVLRSGLSFESRLRATSCDNKRI